MITCKEDLINTYIENDHGELRYLYLAEGRRFGLYSEILKGAYTDEYVAIMPHYAAAQSCSKIPESCLGGQITLSDLRPVKQYAVLHKGGSYSFQSDKPIGDDVVACFDLANSEKPLGEDFFDENKQDDKQMKTYNTYQEAKIANPECAIFECLDKFGTDRDVLDAFGIHSLAMKECNPADHCMTVEEFLKAGYKFEVGDLYFTSFGLVEDVHNSNFAGVMNSDCTDGRDNKRYILRAAALEKPKQIIDTARKAFSTYSIPKLKRTKIEFVKVEDSIWHLEPEFRLGELFAFDGNRDYVKIETEGDFSLSHSSDNLYRRIETEIDERQEFIEECQKYGSWGEMYDSGKFKLVN